MVITTSVSSLLAYYCLASIPTASQDLGSISLLALSGNQPQRHSATATPPPTPPRLLQPNRHSVSPTISYLRSDAARLSGCWWLCSVGRQRRGSSVGGFRAKHCRLLCPRQLLLLPPFGLLRLTRGRQPSRRGGEAGSHVGGVHAAHVLQGVPEHHVCDVHVYTLYGRL